MLEIGVQSKEAILDDCPLAGFRMLRAAGFSCVDFSLNAYLLNLDIYAGEANRFFDAGIADLKRHFAPHKAAAEETGVRIHQMHMPYPIYVPAGRAELNAYLWHEVAPKSMELCAFFGCRYIVVHGFKLARELGSEEAEWEETAFFLDCIAPMAKEMGITVCVENLYDMLGGHAIEGPCCDARKMAERIDRINERYGAEVVGFCFDTGHANLVGLDSFAFLQTLGTRLKVLHIHDNDGMRDLHQIPFTFARTRENHASTDWTGFLSGLRAIHYQGVLNFETAPVLTAFPPAMKQDALAFIARIGRHFAAQIA